MSIKLLLAAGIIITGCTTQQAPAPFSHQGNKVFNKHGEARLANYNSRKMSYNVGYDNSAENVEYIDAPEVESRPLAPVRYNHEPQQSHITSKYDEKVEVSSRTNSSRPTPIVDDAYSTEHASISQDNNIRFKVMEKPDYNRPVRPSRQREISRVEAENFTVPASPTRSAPVRESGEYLDLSKVQNYGDNAKLNGVRPLSKPDYDRIETSAGNTTLKAPKVIAQAPVEKPAYKPTEIAKTANTVKEVEVASIAPQAPAEKVITAKTGNTSAKFIKPLDGETIANFGDKSDGTFNDGINIAASEGTPVKAANGGSVVYSGNQLQGYGNLVIIRHDDGYLTAYAHLRELELKKGTVVNQGEVIGHVGKTGNVDRPQLHFGVRKGREPVNPVDFL